MPSGRRPTKMALPPRTDARDIEKGLVMSNSMIPPEPCLDQSCHRHHDPDERIALAAALCARRSVQLTPTRRQVLELLWRHDGPAGAYELMNAMKTASGRAVAPPTVYRALEFLMEQGLVSKIESRNAYVPCAHPERPHNCLYFICESCGTSTELENPEIENLLERDARQMDFHISRHMVEVTGICSSCADAPEKQKIQQQGE